MEPRKAGHPRPDEPRTLDAGQRPPRRGDRPHPRAARAAAGLRTRHSPRIGHRRDGVGDMVAAGAAPCDNAGLLRCRLGDRRGQAIEARCRCAHCRLWAPRPHGDRSGQRHHLHLERHHQLEFAFQTPTGSPATAPASPSSRCDIGSIFPDIDWRKIDVGTFSWQSLGRRGRPRDDRPVARAIERLEGGPPPTTPKIFRLTKSGWLIDGIFRGETINTPSMLAVEDWLSRSVGRKASGSSR